MLCWFVDRRDLHSFPTRRSSDLSNARVRHRAQEELAEQHALGTIVFGVLRTADRKSTRLNSSHEWISYAVFCLKKKTAQPPGSFWARKCRPTGRSTSLCRSRSSP